MMNVQALIEKFYPEDNRLRQILLQHSKDVAEKALRIVRAHPELGADSTFVEEASWLHDIGIFLTDARGIDCYGTYPYICHGYLGADLLREEGFPRHALVCERHTGAGLALDVIMERNLPVPHRDMRPVSIEEQIICFADKFFSKTHLGEEKSVEKARQSLMKHGEEGLARFDDWCFRFL